MTKRVEVYRNLHTQCFSVRYKGRVIDAVHTILMADADLVVQPAGRNRVVHEKRKNVHAFVRGTRVKSQAIVVGQELTYNPYKMCSFYYKCNGQPIYSAELILMFDNKIWLARYP